MIEDLKNEIKADEGSVNSVYLEHVNLKTQGVGQLVNEGDDE